MSECGICYNEDVKLSRGPWTCQHEYCQDCLDHWHGNCPHCRAGFRNEKVWVGFGERERVIGCITLLILCLMNTYIFVIIPIYEGLHLPHKNDITPNTCTLVCQTDSCGLTCHQGMPGPPGMTLNDEYPHRKIPSIH